MKITNDVCGEFVVTKRGFEVVSGDYDVHVRCAFRIDGKIIEGRIRPEDWNTLFPYMRRTDRLTVEGSLYTPVKGDKTYSEEYDNSVFYPDLGRVVKFESPVPVGACFVRAESLPVRVIGTGKAPEAHEAAKPAEAEAAAPAPDEA